MLNNSLFLIINMQNDCFGSSFFIAIHNGTINFLMLCNQPIVIGSIFARSGELLIPAMEKEIAKEALPLASKVCKIVPAELGENLGDYAALSIASYIVS